MGQNTVTRIEVDIKITGTRQDYVLQENYDNLLEMMEEISDFTNDISEKLK